MNPSLQQVQNSLSMVGIQHSSVLREALWGRQYKKVDRVPMPRASIESSKNPIAMHQPAKRNLSEVQIRKAEIPR